MWSKIALKLGQHQIRRVRDIRAPPQEPRGKVYSVEQQQRQEIGQLTIALPVLAVCNWLSLAFLDYITLEAFKSLDFGLLSRLPRH